MAATAVFATQKISLGASTKGISWVRNGVWSLCEQGLGSCSNQIVSIIVARSVVADEYGAFVLAFSILLVVGVLYYALLVEPMMVFGSGKYLRCFSHYLLLLGYGHWVITCVCSLILVITGSVVSHFGNPGMAPAFQGAAIALPFNLYLLLLRPACYVRNRVRLAATAGFLNLVVSASGMAFFYWMGTISTIRTFAIMAVAAAVASGLIQIVLRRGDSSSFQTTDEDISAIPTAVRVVRDHWSFGGANVLAALGFLASGQLMPLLLIPAFLSLQAEAAVGAVANLFGPLNLLMRSAAVLLLPAVSRYAHTNGLDGRARRYLYVAAIVFAAVAGLYGATMVFCGSPIIRLLYKGQYSYRKMLIVVFSISYMASSVEQVLALGLKAIHKVRTLVMARGTAALICPFVAVPALLTGSLTLVIGAFTVGYLVAGVIIAYRMIQYGRLPRVVESLVP